MKRTIYLAIAIIAVTIGILTGFGNSEASTSKNSANHFIKVTVCPVVQGATVTLSGNGIWRQATTNESGICFFDDNQGLPAGNYMIGVSASGYSPGCINPYYFSATQDQKVSVCFGWACGD